MSRTVRCCCCFLPFLFDERTAPSVCARRQRPAITLTCLAMQRHSIQSWCLFFVLFLCITAHAAAGWTNKQKAGRDFKYKQTSLLFSAIGVNVFVGLFLLLPESSPISASFFFFIALLTFLVLAFTQSERHNKTRKNCWSGGGLSSCNDASHIQSACRWSLVVDSSGAEEGGRGTQISCTPTTEATNVHFCDLWWSQLDRILLKVSASLFLPLPPSPWLHSTPSLVMEVLCRSNTMQ